MDRTFRDVLHYTVTCLPVQVEPGERECGGRGTRVTEGECGLVNDEETGPREKKVEGS